MTVALAAHPIVALGMTAGELGQVTVGLLGAFVGPFLAILITQHLARKQRQREGKLAVFKVLLGTHHLVGDPNFTSAVNLARVEFSDCKPVVSALEAFVESTKPKGRPSTDEEGELMQDRILAVIEEMSKDLGLSMSSDVIKFGSYAAGSMIQRDNIWLDAQRAWPRIATALETQVDLTERLVPDRGTGEPSGVEEPE